MVERNDRLVTSCYIPGNLTAPQLWSRGQLEWAEGALPLFVLVLPAPQPVKTNQVPPPVSQAIHPALGVAERFLSPSQASLTSAPTSAKTAFLTYQLVRP